MKQTSRKESVILIKTKAKITKIPVEKYEVFYKYNTPPAFFIVHFQKTDKKANNF